MTEPNLNRRAFLTGVAQARGYTEGQTLSRREFSLVALIAAVICAFLPTEAAEALLRDLFGTQERTRAVITHIDREAGTITLDSFNAAVKRLYASPSIENWLFRKTSGFGMVMLEPGE